MDLAIALVVLVLLLAAMVWLVVASNVVPAGLVLLLSALWVLVNKPVEGHVLLPITDENGITSSDLLSALGVFLVLAAVTRYASRRPERVRQPVAGGDPGRDAFRPPEHVGCRRRLKVSPRAPTTTGVAASDELSPSYGRLIRWWSRHEQL
jgi:hypothetical protein